jgi:hypothetical protein
MCGYGRGRRQKLQQGKAAVQPLIHTPYQRRACPLPASHHQPAHMAGHPSIILATQTQNAHSHGHT